MGRGAPMQIRYRGRDRERCATGGYQKLNLSSSECQWKSVLSGESPKEIFHGHHVHKFDSHDELF